MGSASRKPSVRTGVLKASISVLLLLSASVPVFAGDSHEFEKNGARFEVSLDDWGTITAPTYGTSESGASAGAALFAGPRKFGNNCFAGVLPSGAFAKPAGTTIQVGMNPLGVVL